jgi:hypothetical protein
VAKRAVIFEWPEPSGNSLLSGVLGGLAERVWVDPFRDLASQPLGDACGDAEVVCFHVDLTLRRGLRLDIAGWSRRLEAEGRYVVNGRVQDISKRSLARHLKAIGLPTCAATRRGPADEPLFVKTNLNYGGRKESRLPPEVVDAAELSGLISAEVGAFSYRVLPRKDVPAGLWSDPAHAIERYVTNSHDSFVRAYFSGVQIIMVVAYAPGPIKKLRGDPRDTNYVTDIGHLKGGAEDFELSDALKSTVCRFVERTPVEFGSIDLVHDDDGHYYVIDLNTTPSGGEGADPELNEHLRLGITEPEYRKATARKDSPLL